MQNVDGNRQVTGKALNQPFKLAAPFLYHDLLELIGPTVAHEAAHRLLFTRQWLNDAVGRWLLAYPSLQAMLAYRRAHFAHHRDEMGPGEPDLGLYQGYPISRASFRRKLTRDAVGISAYKNLKLLARAAVRRKPEALQIIAVQAVVLAGSVLTGRTWMYIVWFVSWCTGWKVSNRLRALAEHGGMKRSRDRRNGRAPMAFTDSARCGAGSPPSG